MARTLAATALALGISLAGGATATYALHEDSHWLAIAAWEVNGEPIERRETRLVDGGGGVPEVRSGDRVRYLVRVEGQSEDVAIQLSFNDPGHAYVIGSASGGSCEAPVEAAPGAFQQACVVAVGDAGDGELLVTYEITRPSDRACGSAQGEPDVAALIVSQPMRHAADVHVCAASAAAPAPSATPAPVIPNTATVATTSHPSSALVVVAAVLLLIAGGVLLPARR